MDRFKYKYIYKTTNLVNSKIYIGSHCSNIEPEKDKYLGSGIHIKNAIKHYGKEFFKREILEFYYGVDFIEFRELEVIYIHKLNSVELGYNINDKSSSGYTEGKIVGKKISASLKGKPKSESHRLNTSKSRMGIVPWNKGKEWGEDVKDKIKETSKNRDPSTYKTDKAHEAVRGHTKSEEIKNNMSESWKKRPVLICPHCAYESRYNIIYKHHFNNCKSKVA